MHSDFSISIFYIAFFSFFSCMYLVKFLFCSKFSSFERSFDSSLIDPYICFGFGKGLDKVFRIVLKCQCLLLIVSFDHFVIV